MSQPGTDPGTVPLADDQSGLYAAVFQLSSQAILITDQDNRIVAVNPALCELSGYRRDELIGRDPEMLDAGETSIETHDAMWRALLEEGRWEGELSGRRKDGKVHLKWTSVAVVRDADDDIVNYITSYTDISERKVTEQRVTHMAHHDALTGLNNRLSLEDLLEQALAQASREGGIVAVLFIDMDRFKQINDTLGHDVGDLLLIEVARRLRATVRESDIVARIGGDEFVVVLTALHDPIMAAGVAAKIVEALGRPYRLGSHEAHSSPSVGVSLFPDDGQEAEALLKCADTAMYHAKERGRNNYQFYTLEMNAAAQERLALERDLGTALAKEQFQLHYQPQVEMASGRLVGVEALLRWDHPELGVILPERFIPIAEGSGLMVPLGEWVLARAAHQLAEWKAAGHRLRMAVNLSPKQLRDEGLLELFRAIKAKRGLDDGELVLEVSESTVVAGVENLSDRLTALHAAGAAIAIDDFGTACTALADLRRLPVSILKIDCQTIAGIENDTDTAALCAAAIALGHALELEVLAEGVESEAQRDYLQARGCDSLQGFLNSRPLPADQIDPSLSGASA